METNTKGTCSGGTGGISQGDCFGFQEVEVEIGIGYNVLDEAMHWRLEILLLYMMSRGSRRSIQGGGKENSNGG